MQANQKPQLPFGGVPEMNGTMYGMGSIGSGDGQGNQNMGG